MRYFESKTFPVFGFIACMNISALLKNTFISLINKYYIKYKNTKIKTAPSIDKGCILTWIVLKK